MTLIKAIHSRRFGQSLEINPLGDIKICSFDCVYCDLGPTEIKLNQIKKDLSFPKIEEIIEQFRTQVSNSIAKSQIPKTVLISGNGEPTLHPDIHEIFKQLLRARDEICAQVPIFLLTNGGHFDKKMLRAVQGIDQIHIKLDAGQNDLFKKINKPLSRSALSRILDSILKIENRYIQSFFIKGTDSNLDRDQVEDWIEAVSMVRPKAVHILGVNSKDLREGVEPCSEDDLEIVASLLKRRVDCDILVFPSS